MESSVSRILRLGLLPTSIGLMLLGSTLMLARPAGAIKFEEPDRRPPKSTVGGGTRGGSSRLAVLPLLPQSGFGITNQARPTFLVYTPTPVETDTVATFYIEDLASGDRHEARVSLSPVAGIASFDLPAPLPDLETNRSYRWLLVLRPVDSTQPRVADPFALGTIERVSAPAASPRGLSVSLAAAIEASQTGRWYDAAAILARLRQQQPADSVLAERWEEFLQSVRLEWLAEAPMAPQHGVERGSQR